MIKLTSKLQARQLRGLIPDIVIQRMEQFEGDDDVYDPDIFGYLIWLEAGDDMGQLTEVSDNGLVDIINDYNLFGSGFECVELYVENGQRIFSMVVAIDADKCIVIFAPDEPWLDKGLKGVLEREIACEAEQNIVEAAT